MTRPPLLLTFRDAHRPCVICGKDIASQSRTVKYCCKEHKAQGVARLQEEAYQRLRKKRSDARKAKLQ